MPDTTFTDVLLNTIGAAGAGMLGSSNLDEMADHSCRLEKDIAQLYELVNRIAQQGDVAGKLHEEVKTLRAQVDELRDYAFGHRREIPTPTPGPLPVEETVPLPRCTVCNQTEGVVECAVCGRNVCKGCAHHKCGHHYHPKCDQGWQR